MKTLLVWTVGLLVVAVTLVTPGGSAPAPDSKHYTDKYDQMDIEPIMNNARARKAFLKCHIEGESCTPEGETLKMNSLDVLNSTQYSSRLPQVIVVVFVLPSCEKRNSSATNKILIRLNMLYKPLSEPYLARKISWEPMLCCGKVGNPHTAEPGVPSTLTRVLRADNIPDALESKCAKCTDAQKKLLRKSSKHLKENNPDEWKQLIDHFDPEGKYSGTFETFLSSED
uniref:Chemosensory protein n=1 Tax=Timema genevievae TaxID=629358 RepID=A0A7R9JVG3_TIMGE|nr:unnamed protein product [Timema genevievae]